jgi:hypothetical protein
VGVTLKMGEASPGWFTLRRHTFSALSPCSLYQSRTRLISSISGLPVVILVGSDWTRVEVVLRLFSVDFLCSVATLKHLCGAVLLLWLLSTVAWCLGSLLRGVPLLGLVPWTSLMASAAARVSPSTSRRAGPDVGGGIGFLGQNLVFAELAFPRRQSTCCELLVASLYLLSNFVQSASIIYLGVIALLWADLFAR